MQPIRYSHAQRHNLKREAGFLLKIGLPAIATQLLQMSLSFVDTIMAGRLSPEDLAAIAVGTSVLLPFQMLCMGAIIAVNPIVAQNLGARRLPHIGKNARQVLWLSQMLALPCFFLFRNLEMPMHWMGVTEEIIPLTAGYLKAISWGVFPMYAYGALRYFGEGLGVTRPAMFVALVGTLVNIPANYVLMFGKLGFPRLGAVGTGYASSIVMAVMFLAILVFTVRFRPYKRFDIFGKFRWPEWEYLWEQVRIGIPIGISSSMEVTMFAVVSLMMSTLGTVIVAGHQVALNFAAITFMIPMGLSIAITARVGRAAGQRRPDEARFRGFVGVGLSVLIMACTALFMILFPDVITAVYTTDEAVRDVAIPLLFMAAVFQISDGLQVSGYGALRGLKDTTVPMFVNLLAYWIVGLPLAWFLGFPAGYGARGMWVGLIVGLTIAAVLHNVRFYRQTRRIITE